MSRVDVMAETIKLARLLGKPESELTYLQPIGAPALRQLREQLANAMFDETRHQFVRVAAASKLLPNGLVALVGEKVFGATLCARIAGLLPPDRALDVALKMPDAFLADVAVQIDPRSARDVISRMPAPRVCAIAAILVQRGDFVTMGRFVDYLPKETIKTVIGSIADNAALLRVGFFIENKAKLNELVGLLATERLRAIIQLASGDTEHLWAEALALMSHVDETWQRKIGDITAAQDPAVLAGLLRATHEQKLWDSLLPIVGRMSEASLVRLAALRELANDDILRAVIEAADANELWGDFLPLASHMQEARRVAAQVVEQLPREMLDRMLATADRLELWPDLLGIMKLMDEDEKGNILRLAAKLGITIPQ